MASERYVVLGLGTARTPWFTEVARWATVGSIPAEFVKCISPEEMRVRLASGRPFSAVLVDATTGAIDRDLIDSAARHQARVLVVDGSAPVAGPDWLGLGAAAVLPPDLRREQLLDALAEHCRLIGAAADLPADPVDEATPELGLGLGRLVAVTGAGGVGSSTIAMATAQAVAGTAGRALLADLCLDADLAMLHDARDVVPGLQELVDAHRSARPSREEVHSLTFDVVNRGYNLLLGLRRHRDWTVLKPRTFESALTGLLASFDVVVADVDDDLEGEAQCGSIDVEERNALARIAVTEADTVVAVGVDGLKGVRDLVRLLDDLAAMHVAPSRIVPVVTRAPRDRAGRAAVTKAVADLCGMPPDLSPVFIPTHRRIEAHLRCADPLPPTLTRPVGRAVAAIAELDGRTLAGALS